MRRVLLLLVLLVSGCGSQAAEPLPDARSAEPQAAVLNWRESYPATGERLVFGVRSFELTEEGWSSEISIENRTKIPFDLGESPPLAFGLMLLPDDDLKTLDKMTSRSGLLLREPTTIEPGPPTMLAPGETWRGNDLGSRLARRFGVSPGLVRASRRSRQAAEGHAAERGLDHGPVVPALERVAALAERVEIRVRGGERRNDRSSSSARRMWPSASSRWPVSAS